LALLRVSAPVVLLRVVLLPHLPSLATGRKALSAQIWDLTPP
jgi:hypothetical protein